MTEQWLLWLYLVITIGCIASACAIANIANKWRIRALAAELRIHLLKLKESERDAIKGATKP